MSYTMDAAIEIEKVILGTCLLDYETATEKFITRLRPAHFCLDSHRLIFAKIGQMHNAGMPVNIVTLPQELDRDHRLEEIGNCPMAYICDLTTGGGWARSESTAQDYIDRLTEFWRLREMRRLGEQISLEVEDMGSVAASIVQTAAARLEAIMDDGGSEDAGVEAHLGSYLNRMYERRKLERSPGLSCGLPDLDARTDGMMPGEQTAVGAASGIGKTAFMAQAVLGTLLAGKAVDAFLLEPTKDQVVSRLISLLTGVRYEALAKPWKMRGDEEALVRVGVERLADLPLRMFSRSGMTLDEVIGQARLDMHRRDVRLIAVDYIQRLRIRATEKDEPMRLRVGRASTALADLVKDTKTHSLVLSQITTGRKGGVNSLPTMFDFRESSQIENDAHTIILLHREYDEQQGHYTNNGAIFVPKQRNGVPCNLKVWFDPVTAAWTNIPPAPKPTWQDQYVHA